MGDNMVAVDLGVGRSPVAIATGRWHTCVLMDNEELKVISELYCLSTSTGNPASVVCVCGASMCNLLLRYQ